MRAAPLHYTKPLDDAQKCPYYRDMSADTHILRAIEDVRAAVRKRGRGYIDVINTAERVADDLLVDAPSLRQQLGRASVVALLTEAALEQLRAA